MDCSNNVTKRKFGHDELHACIGRRGVTFATGDVVDTKHCSCDDQNDERKEGDATESVEGVPVPNDPEFVFLSVCEWHLPVHVVICAF